MENRNLAVMATLEKIKGAVVSFIGLIMIGQGLSYFSPQRIYYVPEILSPVYESFGVIGLDIGLLILGIIAQVWGFRRWRNHNGQIRQFSIIILFGSICVASLLYLESAKNKSVTEKSLSSSANRGLFISDINPDEFTDKTVISYVSEFKTHYQAMETALQLKDEKAYINVYEKLGLWYEKSAQLTTHLSVNERIKFSTFINSTSKNLAEWNERGAGLIK